MKKRFTHTTSLSIGGDEPTWEGEVTLSYTFDPGCDAWGGSRFEPPINPPEGASIDDLRVDAIDGKGRPWIFAMGTDAELEESLLSHIGDSLDDELIANATEWLVADADDGAEARAESRREAWT